MKILAVNAGSSSLKFQLLEMPEELIIASGVVERIGLKDSIFSIKFGEKKSKDTLDIATHKVAVDMLLSKLVDLSIVKSLDDIEGIGHRIVHGGEKFTDSVVIDEKVVKAIEEVIDLAPLHNPANLIGVSAFKEALPNIPAVAVFDTAFHQTMNPVAYMYSVPYECYKDYGVRKYGFHGTSHKYVMQEAKKILKKNKLNLISCHLGNGSSITAIKDNKSIDTSMGFTPVDGLIMGTRTGEVDPGVLIYIADK